MRQPEDPALVVQAAVLAGLLSGAPSTVHALARRRSLLASTRAAGTLLGRPTLVRGLAAHAAVSIGWTAVLAMTLPRRHTVVAGVAAGGVIAALDLGIVARRFPAIRGLPVGPQVLDHLAFGAVVGAVLARGSSGD